MDHILQPLDLNRGPGMEDLHTQEAILKRYSLAEACKMLQMSESAVYQAAYRHNLGDRGITFSEAEIALLRSRKNKVGRPSKSQPSA